MTDPPRPARILLVEDSQEDAELMVGALRKAGLDIESRVVADEASVRAVLPAFSPDLILADLSMPGFSGTAALAIAREWDPAVPCILVSGTLGADLVGQAVRTGATDYVPKQHLDALAPAVRRALAEGAERRARAKLEAALAESQALLAALMAHVPDHVYFKDAESRFTMISRSMARSFGLDSPAQAIGRTDADFFTAEQAAKALEDEGEVMRTGRPLVDRTERETWPDGRETWASTTKVPYTDGQGQALGTFGISRDITARMATEAALRESEARHRSVVETLGEGIILQDVEGAIYAGNTAAATIFGRTGDELLGWTPADGSWTAIHEDGSPFTSETNPGRVTLATGLPATGVIMGILKPEGTVTWISINARPLIRPGEVAPYAVVSSFFDISELKAARAVLEDSEERLRVAFDTMLEGVCVQTAIRGGDGQIVDFRIEYANEAIARISGVPVAEQVGRTLLELFPAHRDNGLLDAYVRVVETGVAYESGIIRYVDPGAAGGALDQALEHAAARMGDGYVLSVRDVSARKAAEDEINRLTADLERRVAARTAGLQAANEELQTFSYTVSHDLRSPLRAMTGFAELLAKRAADGLDERSRHYLANIIEGGERMSQLIEELLDYSRLGRSHVQTEPVVLGPVLHRIRQVMVGRIKATHGTLVVVEPLAVPVADPVLLEQMLVNLLDNAFLYRRPDVAPVVTVSAVRDGQRVTLAVGDNGIGIPAEHLEKVFEPFVRLHRADEYPGTGIGLATVRKAAALMDSAIRVESVAGVGSTFSLDLPAAGQTVA